MPDETPVTYEKSLDRVARLVEDFARNQAAYRAPKYKEAHARQEFIDPLFIALGWDVRNRQHVAPQYREVIPEASLDTESGNKAPDYVFRIGQTRKFFVEAKKPGVSIKNDAAPAYQLRRYAWSAKLPLSLLTDFEELAVYDCRARPSEKDKASAGRIDFYTFEEYPDRWREVWDVFSRQAAWAGSFDQYAQTAKGKRGTSEVDAEFLKEIEGWRDGLARNFALRNPRLSTDELNDAVQRTIDRIIFLRMAEDRRMEEYERLLRLARGDRVYAGLIDLSRAADAKYNSGLFDFSPQGDTLTPSLTLDDRVLKPILDGLYYPQSPYEFSVLPADILGHVYEQFLGKVIRLTAGHRAKVEEKPEVKKAGGVYYTPTYIVAYIVDNTVGRLVDGKSPRQLKGFRVLDPACGSGSFLLGAYQYLLDHYLKWYVEHEPEKHPKAVWQHHPVGAVARSAGNPSLRAARHAALAAGSSGEAISPVDSEIASARESGPRNDEAVEWRLTTAEKKRILTEHIFGVDIDRQAVEVTKLSLLLKVLEGESDETLGRQLALFQERALPNLDANVKCGNSLIGPDYFAGQLLPDPDELRRVNPFDWEREFPDAMQAGGFDAVIGNPPYRRELDFKHLMDEIARTPFGMKYRAPRMDLWYYFVHRGLELLKRLGTLSFITNAYWTAGTGAEKLISALRESNHINEIFFLGKSKVFQNVSGQHMIMRIRKTTSTDPTAIKIIEPDGESTAEPYVTGRMSVLAFYKTAEQLFHSNKVDLQPPADDLLSRLDSFASLDSLGIVRQGIAENPSSVNRKTNEKFGSRWAIGEGVFALRPEEVERLKLPKHERNLLRPYHDLSDLGRYFIAPVPSLVLIYSTRNSCPQIEEYPVIKKHLSRFRVIMEARRETRKGSNAWWHLHWPRDERIWQAAKIMSVQMGARPAFAPSEDPVYVSFSVNVFVPSTSTKEHLNYLTGLLNSRLMWKWYQHNAKRRGVGLEINGNVLARTPIRPIDFSDSADKVRHDRVVTLVENMLELHKRLAAARTPSDRELYQRQIDATDRHIDALVYALYGLTDEEIKIVEETT